MVRCPPSAASARLLPSGERAAHARVRTSRSGGSRCRTHSKPAKPLQESTNAGPGARQRRRCRRRSRPSARRASTSATLLWVRDPSPRAQPGSAHLLFHVGHLARRAPQAMWTRPPSWVGRRVARAEHCHRAGEERSHRRRRPAGQHCGTQRWPHRRAREEGEHCGRRGGARSR